MEKSKFQFSAANLTAGKLGTRSTNDAYAEIIVKQTPAQFGLNGKAVDLLGAKNGDKIAIFINEEAETLSEQFLVAIAPEGYADGAKLSSIAKTGAGKTLSFSWHSMWSIAMQQTLGAAEMGNEGLVKAEIIEKTEKAYVAKNRISYKLVEVEDAEDVEINGATFAKLFVLEDPKLLDIVVRNSADEEENEDEYSTTVED